MADELTLSGRAAIVTGAGNGLGRAESLALARAGALLVLNDLPGDAIRETAEQVRAAGGQAVVVRRRHRGLGDRRSGWSAPRLTPTAGWTSWSTTPASFGTG